MAVIDIHISADTENDKELLASLGAVLGGTVQKTAAVVALAKQSETTTKKTKASTKTTKKVEDPVEDSTEAPAEVEDATEKEITLDDLREVLALKKDDHRDAIKAKLEELGAKRVSAVEEKDYRTMYDFMHEL